VPEVRVPAGLVVVMSDGEIETTIVVAPGVVKVEVDVPEEVGTVAVVELDVDESMPVHDSDQTHRRTLVESPIESRRASAATTAT
jgi:hypothetical protein